MRTKNLIHPGEILQANYDLGATLRNNREEFAKISAMG